MKKSLKKLTVFALAMSLTVTSLTGCNKGSGEEAEVVASEKASDPAWQEAMTTPFGKYPELVTYTLGKEAGNYDALDGTDYAGDDDTNNAWTRYFKEKINVQNENVFEANDGEDYDQKISMAIVSGEIPDIMMVPDYETLKLLQESDLLADLTEIYENCASDRVKEIYDSYGGRNLDTAKFDGKLMALPTTEISHGPGIFWVRKDWMEKLSLEEPKTMEDIENLLAQFVEKDPGNNGAGKTIGMVLDTEVAGKTGGDYQINNIFTLFGAYPKQWIDDGNGGAVYGSVQPEMKEALAKAADMYKRGLIDTQLAVRTSDDITALLTNGQCGAFFSNWWGSWRVADSKKLNKEAEWVPYICPTNQDGEVTMFTGDPNSSYLVVRKGFEYPEIALKMVSLQYDYQRYQDKDENSIKELTVYAEKNVSGSPISMNVDYFDAFTRNAENISKALESGDSSSINNHSKNSYDRFKKYLEDVESGAEIDVNAWADYESSMVCAALVSDSKIKQVDPVFFGNTASMTLKWPTLSKMEQEMMLKIIMGEQSVDSFDNFVKTWNSTGGADITKEVNEAMKSK